jgi:putative peptidoglycan lipid II flippase
MLVATGIMASRSFGFVRNKIFAYYFGTGIEAAAYAAATKIPNFLQNLLGEGVLSASFIPVYASLRARGEHAQAKSLASAVLAALVLVVNVMVLCGIVFTPQIVSVIVPGYHGQSRELTIALTRVIFPSAGILVISAWCLGILNSHRQFLLSYAAPVIANVVIIVALLVFRTEALPQFIVFIAWATIAGSVLQVAVQVPTILKTIGFLSRPARSESLSQVLRGFLPSVLARGVVQVSAYVDTQLASLISERAVTVLSSVQNVALLPLSLFGMAISAAELPEMSADAALHKTARDEAIRSRLETGLTRLNFLVVPCAVALLGLGDCIAAVLLQGGKFTAQDSRFFWLVCLGFGLSLLAQTQSRLLSSSLYAMENPRSPFRIAVARVVVGVALGVLFVRVVPVTLGVGPELGAILLPVASAISALLERLLLQRTVERELGSVATARTLSQTGSAAALALVLCWAVKWIVTFKVGADAQCLAEWGGQWLPMPALTTPHQVLFSLALLVLFGIIYLMACAWLGVPSLHAMLQRVRSRFVRRP